MKPIKARLTKESMAIAGMVALFRQIENIEKNRKHAHGASNEYSWQMHIEGCMGEFITAKYLGIFWDGKLGDLSPGDIGKIEARTAGGATGFEKGNIHDRRLCIHKTDKDDSPFVHITGVNGYYQIHGWLYGKEGKKDEYWQDPTGQKRFAYYADNDKLRSMPTLKELVDAGTFR